MKEKQLYLAEKEKAKSLKEAFDKAQQDQILLNEALDYFVSLISAGDEVTHKTYGKGVIKGIDKNYIEIAFLEKETQISLPIAIANGLISMDKKGFAEKADEYRGVLKKYNSIPNRLEYAARALEPYEEYLE